MHLPIASLNNSFFFREDVFSVEIKKIDSQFVTKALHTNQTSPRALLVAYVCSQTRVVDLCSQFDKNLFGQRQNDIYSVHTE